MIFQYVIEDEIKKELMNVKTDHHAKLKEEVNKALNMCKHRKNYSMLYTHNDNLIYNY